MLSIAVPFLLKANDDGWLAESSWIPVDAAMTQWIMWVIRHSIMCSSGVWQNNVSSASVCLLEISVLLVRIVQAHWWTLRTVLLCESSQFLYALQIGRSWVRLLMASLEFFIDIILPATLWPWGRLSLQQKWVPGIFPGGKGGRCVGLTLSSSCADCLEIWEPQPAGTLWACQACNGTALPSVL
jgi:hypothetical protein